MNAGVEISLRIGQRVRHTDYKGKRVTGIVRGLSVDSEQGLMVQCALDAPIVIPPGDGFDEIKIWHQHAQAHEFSPFDERDELLADMLAALQIAEREMAAMRAALGPGLITDEAIALARAAIAKATGSAQ